MCGIYIGNLFIPQESVTGDCTVDFLKGRDYTEERKIKEESSPTVCMRAYEKRKLYFL